MWQSGSYYCRGQSWSALRTVLKWSWFVKLHAPAWVMGRHTLLYAHTHRLVQGKVPSVCTHGEHTAHNSRQSQKVYKWGSKNETLVTESFSVTWTRGALVCTTILSHTHSAFLHPFFHGLDGTDVLADLQGRAQSQFEGHEKVMILYQTKSLAVNLVLYEAVEVGLVTKGGEERTHIVHCPGL